MRIAIMVALAVPLASCGGGPEPGGLTEEESRQLNEAAAMLDAAEAELPVPAETGALPVASDAVTNAQ